jgi:hypothetical protein
MNRSVLIPFLVLIVMGLFVGASQTARAQFGVAGGLNYESADDLANGGADATLQNRTGYHFGVVYDIDAGAVNIRPGLIYRRVGTYEFEVGEVDVATESFNLSAIEAPLDLRFRLMNTPYLRPYILTGPMFTLPRGEDEFGEAVRDLSLSLNVGVGAEIAGGDEGIRLHPELRYEFGATKFITEDFEIDGQELRPQNEARFSAIRLRLHILF